MNILSRILRATVLVSSLLTATTATAQQGYTPTEENLRSRQEFADSKFGIFIHWGIYSMFAQGEWYLQNATIDKNEYAKAADAFYPHRFNAREWVSAIKDAGAKYICFTTRHHDSFSMWDTEQSEYNIVDATPFGRDVLRELADECHAQGIRLHFYYSHLDWMRDEYPMGRTGSRIICINETCSKFLPEDQRGYYKKKTEEAAPAEEKPAKKTSSKKTAEKKSAAKKTTTRKTKKEAAE